jgi:hypothetical protein
MTLHGENNNLIMKQPFLPLGQQHRQGGLLWQVSLKRYSLTMVYAKYKTLPSPP